MVTPANGRLVHRFQPTGGSRLLTFLFSPRNTSLPLPLSHAAQAGRPLVAFGTGEKMTTGQISTSALLNKSVLNEANESIGDVNDVILEPVQGRIKESAPQYRKPGKRS